VIQESFLKNWDKFELQCKERGIDEGATSLIYVIISVRFKFPCYSLLSAEKNIFFLFDHTRNRHNFSGLAKNNTMWDFGKEKSLQNWLYHCYAL
jgi:hypothetical protein